MSFPDQPGNCPSATGGVRSTTEAAATLYTAKGGQGCTTTAVALAALLGRTHPVALVAHNPADVLAIAGRAPIEGAASVPLTTGTSLVLDGSPTQAGAGEVIRDAGPTLDTTIAPPRPAETATYLVTRPCFLALRAALEHRIRPTGIIVLDEPGRAITADDIEAILNKPVVATIPVTPAIARTVDAGLLASSLPGALVRSLQPIADAIRRQPQPCNPMAPDARAMRRSPGSGRGW